KGLTFDAGGLSIKSGQGMMDMKMDVGGAAAVVGAMSVLPAVAPACRVRAYLPMTDNMLGGDATRPGDVLTIRNGKTIEVLNTDAEGRLVLADALSLASEAKPDAIVDLATLTGACVVALGPTIAGLMGRDDDFLEQVEAASERTGEQVWRLPLPDEYRKMVDSPVADMKNIGGPYAGALTAGIILREFVAEGIPWAHLDIAGPAFSDSDDAETTRGGTGFGVRLLVDLATTFTA
ncbi:MAG: leucyl aminopeptidase, partial [Actinomycetota bacterium]|nr:leucyl aminopeptidase [Actinomycetota bacterium]